MLDQNLAQGAMLMTPPTIDATDPDALMKELFDDDGWVKDQFREHLGDRIHELCNVLADCFVLMGKLNDAAKAVETVRTALVGAFVFGVLDDLLTSTKLLLTGKFPASGNLMRQVIEGIAISVLCAAEMPVILKRKNKNSKAVTAIYWECFNNSHDLTRGFLAIDQLEWNAETLGVFSVAVVQLQERKSYYNAFSHCGTATITNRISLEGPALFHLGGHFDDAKLATYRAELESRINLCRVLPQFIRHLLCSVSSPDAKPVVKAIPPEPV
ncbi:hypothetical protein [Paraburkholderia bannensis]|uniref:hypothetical protein n=1 Tax=Paraburkholderia bannensis TaxID=765414 RepID=UPI000A7707BC|nr:hypothetical protein [Paraburkholderia bannensis]